MLIVSKFHDYYDSIRALGIDKTCVYKRTEQTLKGTFEVDKERKWYQSSWVNSDRLEGKKGFWYEISFYVIGFCGKLHPLVIVSKESVGHVGKKLPFYDKKKLYEYFEKEKVKLESKYRYRSSRGFNVENEQSMDKFFDPITFKGLSEEFHKHQCPVFIYGRLNLENGKSADAIRLNPRLADYSFAKVKDPQTAFQDIYMFIMGVIGMPAPEMVQISDKEMAKKRGHDGKYSFKKPPGGKRGKPKWR